MKQIIALLSMVSVAAILNAAPPARLTRAIDNSETFVLEGHIRPLLQSAQDLGEADSSLALTQLEVQFTMTAAQTADLNALLASQRDRSSSSYQKWLTPEQFAARFGVNDSDLNKVKAWLESAGFTNIEASPSRSFLRMSGTPADVKNLFNSDIHQYQRNGRKFYANNSDPVFPRALQGLVSGLKGMSNYQARSFVTQRPQPQISVGINGNHFLGPDDLATIYDFRTLYNQGIDGTGEKIVVVGQSNIDLSDIEAFQEAVKFPIKDPQVILVGTDPGKNEDAMEADLDLEWTGAVARGATLIYVNSTSALDSAVYAINSNLAPVISISYGLCEAALAAKEIEAYEGAFKQANVQGITVVVASGDTGAAACDVSTSPQSAATQGLAVSYPASSQYVTAVGGTEFSDVQGTFWNSGGQAISYIPEVAWNDTSTFKVLSGSGGGASQLFAKPTWQVGSGVPVDNHRDVPDIALSASPSHDPYLICSLGSCSNGFAPPVSKVYFVGGTSASAPVFAGILALLNQSTNGRQGNVNQGLYNLASFNSGVFHDVELGDNRVPCVGGTANCTDGMLGFSAGPGYDQVTGLGSVDANQLVQQWGSDFHVALSPAFLNFNTGSAGTINLQVTRFASFAGSVNFTCSVAGSLTNTSCTVTSSVNGTGPAVLKVTNTSAASLGASWSMSRRMPLSCAILLTITLAGLLLWTGKRRPVMSAGFATLCLLTALGCGSGSPVSTSLTPVSKSMTGTVTVTATSGTLQHVITVPVTIS